MPTSAPVTGADPRSGKCFQSPVIECQRMAFASNSHDSMKSWLIKIGGKELLIILIHVFLSSAPGMLCGKDCKTQTA